MPLIHYQKQSLWSPLWLPIALIGVRIKCQGPTVLPETQCCSTAMSTDPSKSWLLGEAGSQSASLTFAFVLYKVRVTVISNLWNELPTNLLWGISSSAVIKNSPAMQEMWVQVPESGRSPGEGNGNPLQYSCLENPMDRGVWRAAVHGVAKSWTRLSN